MIEFTRAYSKSPRLLFGLNSVDAEGNRPRMMSLSKPEVTAKGFRIEASSLSMCNGFDMGCSWLTLPNDLHLETAMINTYALNRETTDFEQHVYFSQSFDAQPEVVVWFQEFEWPSNDWMSIKCSAVEINEHSFKLRIESWAGRRFKNARVQYLAYEKEDSNRIKSGRGHVTRQDKERDEGRVGFRGTTGTEFKGTPKTFIAISELDFNGARNLRFRSEMKAVNNMEMTSKYGTWDDSDMDHGDIVWIAID